MTRVQQLELPAEVLANVKVVVGQIVGSPGVAVSVSRDMAQCVGGVLQRTLNERMNEVRERERSPSDEVLKLRFR